MSASVADPKGQPDPKQLAKNGIAWLVGQVGQELVQAVWGILSSGGTDNISQALTAFVEGVLREARALLTDEELAAEIAAANLAVDAEVDALEAARLAAMAAKGAKP